MEAFLHPTADEIEQAKHIARRSAGVKDEIVGVAIADLRAAETKRRARKAAKVDDDSKDGPLFDDQDDAETEEAAGE